MNRMITLRQLLICGISVALFLMGCTPDEILPKDDILPEEEGRLISFGASTTVTDIPNTKTVYTGEFGIIDVGSWGYPEYVTGERINWVPDIDKVRIISTEAIGGTAVGATAQGQAYHYADYLVKSIPSTGSAGAYAYDYATLAPINDGLRWNDEGGYYMFFSIYPSPVDGNSGIQLSDPNMQDHKGYVRITFNVPQEQPYAEFSSMGALYEYKPDMNLAYMYAGVQHQLEVPNLPLTFHPVVNAFEFTINAADEAAKGLTLKSFKLSLNNDPYDDPDVSDDSPHYLSGQYSGNISSANTWEAAHTVTSPSTDVIVNIKESDRRELGDNSYRLTLFTLPLDKNIIHNPSQYDHDLVFYSLTVDMVFTDGTDDIHRILDLKTSEGIDIGPQHREDKMYFTISVPGTIGSIDVPEPITPGHGFQLTSGTNTYKIDFASGNLANTDGVSGNWYFLDEQYMSLNDNHTTDPMTGARDVFTWSELYENLLTVGRSGSDYSSSSAATGSVNVAINGATDWRLPTFHEYVGLLRSSSGTGTNQSDMYRSGSLATVNGVEGAVTAVVRITGTGYDLGDTGGVTGLLMFPDGYVDNSATIAQESINTQSYFTVSSITKEQFDRMSAAGAVFFPAVGEWGPTTYFNEETGAPYGIPEWHSVGEYFGYFTHKAENAAGGAIPMLDFHSTGSTPFYSAFGSENQRIYWYHSARLVHTVTD